jgi:NAD(P)H-dependent flavin oxidoreductase YrpB (nitropropane dioxygenase family)
MRGRPEFKQAYLDSKEDDIVIINSPVGLLGRAIHNQFLRNSRPAPWSGSNAYRRLTTCNIAEARYCIAQALVSAYQGDMDKGLVFCGQNACRVNEIVSVKKLIAGASAEIGLLNPPGTQPRLSPAFLADRRGRPVDLSIFSSETKSLPDSCVEARPS